MKYFYSLALLLLTVGLPVLAGGRGIPGTLPVPGSSPLLYVRFTGPKGMRVTFYRGQGAGVSFPAPVTVALRPGYLYRVKLTDLPGHPDMALFPTLEVHSTLALGPKCPPYEYPAPAVIHDLDIEQVLSGAMLTKVVYLEHPEKAPPKATTADNPLETTLPACKDLWSEAVCRGRPVFTLRMGQRHFEESELAACAVPGTVLLPDEQVLPRPAVPPCLPWSCLALVDPILGPRPPEEECLHDGGDVGLPAGLDNAGRLHGLDPSDTIAEYCDDCGHKRLVCSNRICVCVPRFAVLRTELPPALQECVIGPGGTISLWGQDLLQARVPSLLARQREQMAAMTGRKRPSLAVAKEGLVQLVALQVLNAEEIVIGPAVLLGTAEVQQLTEVQRLALKKQIEFARVINKREGPRQIEAGEGPAVVARLEGLQIIKATAETRECEVSCEAPVPPAKPLCLHKWADKQCAQVGDVVTFYLKYSNVGGRPMTEVAVNDSLTGRLEYVPGSAQSSRDAVFTMENNEAGSVILRWEINGRLLPGQYGVVRFQARVR
jgi:uncharacterized repeat protein (TIGR01451 family)